LAIREELLTGEGRALMFDDVTQKALEVLVFDAGWIDI